MEDKKKGDGEGTLTFGSVRERDGGLAQDHEGGE